MRDIPMSADKGSSAWAAQKALGEAQRLAHAGQWTAALTRLQGLAPLRLGANGLALRAAVWEALGEHGQCGRDATAALQAQPGHQGARRLQANALLKVGQPALALAAFTRLEQLEPGAAFIACLRVFLARRLADWRGQGLPMTAAELNALREQAALTPKGVFSGAEADLWLLRSRALRGWPALEPLAALHLYDEPALARRVSQVWMEQWAALKQAAPPCPGLAADGAVKVAYLSSDFYNHATAWLLAGVLQAHDSRRVKVWLLSYGAPRDDAMSRRLKAMGHVWVDAHAWSDEQTARYCRAQGMHIAVDLKGLTLDGRTGIFARRASPVQVNWLGYPGTMDAAFYDYIIGDAQLIPAQLRPHIAENVVVMPHCYQPTDNGRAVACLAGDRAEQRRAQGLPERAMVLCSFNATAKITLQVWGVWMRLLKSERQAVLWLQASADARKNLLQHAASAGIEGHRLVFAEHLPQAEHLARLALADLSLDTWPCGAHTTASDALWAGVPHVTMAGQSLQARVGASVLHAAGLSELITESAEGYEALTTRLVSNPTALAEVRSRLVAQRRTCALFDTQRFARDLEEGFYMMAARAWAGQPAADLVVGKGAARGDV